MSFGAAASTDVATEEGGSYQSQPLFPLSSNNNLSYKLGQVSSAPTRWSPFLEMEQNSAVYKVALRGGHWMSELAAVLLREKCDETFSWSQKGQLSLAALS